MFFLVFKQKTAYEMRISDWSSDVCSSDLPRACAHARRDAGGRLPGGARRALRQSRTDLRKRGHRAESRGERRQGRRPPETARQGPDLAGREGTARHLSVRSEEHTSELQSLMRISYAVFCLKKKKNLMN